MRRGHVNKSLRQCLHETELTHPGMKCIGLHDPVYMSSRDELSSRDEISSHFSSRDEISSRDEMHNMTSFDANHSS